MPAASRRRREHRRALHTIYNHYARCSADPGYRAEREAEQAAAAVFTTSFLIDDFTRRQRRFGAAQLLLSSASSKTAYGTAFCLAAARPELRVLGLTSQANLDFTRALGCYAAS